MRKILAYTILLCCCSLQLALAQAPCAVGSLNIQSQGISCNGQTDASLSPQVTGAAGGNFGYSWSTGQTTANLSGLAAGVYSLTLTDTLGGAGAVDTLYRENFNGTHGWALNQASGPNGADNNFWVVSDNEGGTTVGSCGLAGGGDNTLHITSQLFPTAGASYNATGFCGLLFCTQTNMRAESPAFSTLGYSSVSVTFDFIGNGQTTLDVGSFVINDGSGWQTEIPVLRSTICASGQGEWTNVTLLLPASAANNTNLQIGFNWTNNEDNIGTDPSIAINNIFVLGENAPTLCTYTETVTITEPSALGVTVTNAQRPNCDAGNAQGSVNVVAGGGVGGYSYLWSNGAQTQNISGLQAGVYALTLSDANGCTATASADLNLERAVLSVSDIDERLCFGQSDGFVDVATTGLSAGNTASYLWSSGQTTASISALAAGIYTLSATVPNGNVDCISTLQVTMREADELEAFINLLRPLNCSGENTAALAAESAGGWGNPSYTWSNGGDTREIENLAAGNYSLTLSDEEGCQSTAGPFQIEPLPLPQLNAWIGELGQKELQANRGDEFELNAGFDEPGVAYTWTGDFLRGLTGASVLADASEDGEFLYVVQATLGPCSINDTLRLLVEPSFLGMPTAFTPNQAQNNIFRPVALDAEYIRSFTVFNRWGQIVYDDPRLSNGGWDGSKNGEAQPRDVYMYILEYQLPENQEPVLLRGEVTLLR